MSDPHLCKSEITSDLIRLLVMSLVFVLISVIVLCGPDFLLPASLTCAGLD